MKNQQGAALVIVMALLSGALMIGISGMNSALIDERLAGNYRAVALAQMAAEDVAGYIRVNYPPPSHPEGWMNLDSDAIGFIDNKDVTLRRSFFSCDTNSSSNSDADGSCGQIYDYGSGRWITPNPLGNPFYIARGEVIESEGSAQVVAKHLIVVGQVLGSSDDPFNNALPDNIFAYALLVGDDITINGGANISGTVRLAGNYKGNENQDEIEFIIEDGDLSEYSPGGLDPGNFFIEEVRNFLGYENGGSQCLENEEYNILYCYGDADVDLDNIEGRRVVVEGKATVKGKVDDEEGIVIIAGGDVDFKGMGGNSFTGFVWSGGSLVFSGQGGTQYKGSFVSANESTFNGGLNIDFLDFAGGSEGYEWLPL